MAALRQRVAEVEAAAAAYADKFGQAKVEGAAAAEAARAAAVAPLQAEVARLTERVQSLQQLHAAELAAIEAAARQQVAAAQAAAQTEVDRLSSAGTNVQAQLRGESARAEGLAADLSRLQVRGLASQGMGGSEQGRGGSRTSCCQNRSSMGAGPALLPPPPPHTHTPILLCSSLRTGGAGAAQPAGSSQDRAAEQGG